MRCAWTDFIHRPSGAKGVKSYGVGVEKETL
jgi:hypothetical protein